MANDPLAFYFPIYVLINPNAVDATISMRGVLRNVHPQHGEAPLVFADLILATECISKTGDARYEPLELKDDLEAITFADAAEKWGCKYLIFDAENDRGRYVSIELFRSMLRPK